MTAAHKTERRTCRLANFGRSMQQSAPTRDETALRARLETLAVLKL